MENKTIIEKLEYLKSQVDEKSQQIIAIIIDTYKNKTIDEAIEQANRLLLASKNFSLSKKILFLLYNEY